MDIGKGFTFIFDDEDWIKKLLIGAVVLLIPILSFAGFGYVLQLTKNVRDGEEKPLPEWDNLGEYFIEGLKLFVGLFLYFIPMFIVICGLLGSFLGIDVIVNRSEVQNIQFIALTCCFPFILLAGFFPLAAFPAMMANYADRGDFGAMFNFREIYEFIRRDLGSYILLLLLSWVATNFLAPLGLIIFCLGAFFTQWWSYLVIGHLTGQLMQNNKEVML